MLFTHDRKGRPIPPEVLEILNKPVPVRPHRKRTASMAISPPPSEYTRSNSIPSVSDIPDLFVAPRSRKVLCQRVPCDGPLDLDSEDEEEEKPECGELVKKRESFSWLKSMFAKVATQKVRQITATPELAENPELVVNDFPERTGCYVPLDTYKVEQTPGQTQRVRSPRLNSNFYRVLALERTMCEKGKLQEPAVSMFLNPRQETSEPGHVFGIQPKLRRRRERRWQELTSEDFQDAD